MTYFMVYRIPSFLWFCVDTAHKDIYDTLLSHFSNGLLLSTFFPVFNISKLNQIEIKTRFLRECEAFLWL